MRRKLNAGVCLFGGTDGTGQCVYAGGEAAVTATRKTKRCGRVRRHGHFKGDPSVIRAAPCDSNLPVDAFHVRLHVVELRHKLRRDEKFPERTHRRNGRRGGAAIRKTDSGQPLVRPAGEIPEHDVVA